MRQSNKQLVELAAIVLFIVGISALIWNITPYSSMPSHVAVSTVDTPTYTRRDTLDRGLDRPLWTTGKSLFKSNCASCHNPKVATTGPALMGAEDRWQKGGLYKGKSGKQWLYVWIRNWHEAVEAKYPYAVDIQNYSPSEMNIFPALKDTDIAAILYYVSDPISEVPVSMP